MTDDKRCTFCKQPLEEDRVISNPHDNLTVRHSHNNPAVRYCQCPNCGTYSIDLFASATIPENERANLHEFSGAIRELNEMGKDFGVITEKNYKDLLSNVSVPKKLSEKLSKLLLFIYRRTAFLEQSVLIPHSLCAAAYAAHEAELRALVNGLRELGYIKDPNQQGFFYALTIKGFQKAENQLKRVDEKLCFVAM